jgi:hypothetical protein
LKITLNYRQFEHNFDKKKLIESKSNDFEAFA